MTSAEQLFARHLDLAPLRGRRRGVVRCIFQPRDRTPSLSVDLDAGLFNCFSCGVAGGVTKFAKLVGEVAPSLSLKRQTLGPLEAARRDALERERRAEERRARLRPLMQASDDYRVAMREVLRVRRIATAAGPDSEAAWELLALTAAAETRAEADLAEATE